MVWKGFRKGFFESAGFRMEEGAGLCVACSLGEKVGFYLGGAKVGVGVWNEDWGRRRRRKEERANRGA